MNDEQLTQALQQQAATREHGRVPAFDDVFAAASKQAQTETRRRRAAGAIAAAVALLAIVANLVPEQQPDWQYVDPELFATTTSWVAPSDVLLPQHSVDIYEEIPVFIEGTKIDGGSLL